MCNKNKLSIILILLCPLLYFNCKKDKNENNLQACQACMPFQKPAGSYIYPITGGTPEWTALTNWSQKFAVCQISRSDLDLMDTDALLQSCLDFPLLGDVLLNVGVYIPGVTKYFSENFSGLIELSERSDAGEKIYKRYAKISPSCIAGKNTGFSSTNFSAFETIIGEDNMLPVFNDDFKRKMVKEAITKYYCKKSYPNDYAYYSYATSAYVMAKIMFNKNFQPFMQEFNNNPELRLFVHRLLWPSTQKDTDVLFDTIIKNANQFVQ